MSQPLQHEEKGLAKMTWIASTRPSIAKDGVRIDEARHISGNSGAVIDLSSGRGARSISHVSVPRLSITRKLIARMSERASTRAAPAARKRHRISDSSAPPPGFPAPDRGTVARHPHGPDGT